VVSTDLKYYRGALSLRYANGAVCEADNKYRHTTVISFVCHRSAAPHLQQPTAPVLKPIYIGDDKETCTHYFSWHTHAACEVLMPCAAVKTGSYGRHHAFINFKKSVSHVRIAIEIIFAH